MSTKSERLKEMLKIANDGLSREEFLESFKKVIDHILKTEIKLIEKIDFKTKAEKEKMEALRKEFSQVIDQAKKESDSTLGGFRKRTMEAINKLFTRNEVNKKLKNILKAADTKIIEVDNTMATVTSGTDGIDGIDGKDADVEKIIKEVLDKIEIPEKEIGIEDVGNLRDELEELRKIKTKGGGGVSAMGVAQAAKWIVKTEEPSGTIDGANTAFTVSKPRIFAILAMSLNGEFIARLPNYTIAGNTITFSEAIPAAYDGKDWEIVYI